MSDDKQCLTTDEADEFSDTLKALESTIKKHLSQQEKQQQQQPVMPAAFLPIVQRMPRSLSSLKRENVNDSAGAKMPNRSDRVIVFMRIIILKLGDIDTMRDKFSADAFIQCKWREPALDGKIKTKGETIDWEKCWNPRISLENVIGEPKEQLWHSISFDAHGLATVYEKRRVTGAFLEFMELYQFPFDTQDLSVSIISDRDESEIELIEDPKEKCMLNVSSFGDVQEWHLHPGCSPWMDIKEENFNNVQKRHPTFGAACQVSRRPQFFIWNILVVMTLICSLSFSTFSVSFAIPQNRLQLTFILLLTTVSFKFVANQNLPTISYLTYLDRYILGLMGILITICIWHAVIFYILQSYNCKNFDQLYTVDFIAFAVFICVYVIFHFVFMCTVACVEKKSAGHGSNAADDTETEFDEDCADDYSNPNLGAGASAVFGGAASDANDDNNQSIIAACGFDG